MNRATTRDRAELLILCTVATIGFALALAYTHLSSDTKPMPCHEDEALVWLDAPTTAHCVNLEELP